MEQYLEEQLHCLCRSVRAADERAVEAAKRHWNGIAKPLHGLGRFEDLLTKVAGIQNTENIKWIGRPLWYSVRTTVWWPRV